MNQTTTALIEHLSHVAEEIAKLKSELQTEKRDWELTNELLKNRIDELQIQAQDKDKEIWKIKQDARDEIFQEREKVVADYMEIIIKKDEEIARLKEAVKNNAKVVVEASAAEIIVIKGLQLRNKELEEETYLCECGVLNLTKYKGCAYCKRPMITRPKKKLEKIIDDEFGLCLMEHKINEIIEYLNKGSKK